MSPRKPHPVPVPPVQPVPVPVPDPPVVVPVPVPVAQRRWGVILGDESQGTLNNFKYLQSKGVTVVTVLAPWEFLQGSPQADVRSAPYWSQFTQRLRDARDAGLRVSLNIGCHYPPQWVLDIVPKYRQADGTTWAGVHGTGSEVRDWIWSSLGQSAHADFTVRVLNGIAGAGLMDTIDSVRLGMGPYGECHFPRPGKYDSPATVTSSFQTAPPTDPLNRDNWYLDSMSRAIVWGIGVIRRVFSGPIWVLHPSTGIRPSWPIGRADYVVELNAGCDPARYIRAYAGLPGCGVYSTWLEDPNPEPSWAFLLSLASAAGLPMWGENADPNAGPAGMSRMFDAVAAGVAGCQWITRETFLPLADQWAGKVAAA